jgi:hypothetical protein
MAFPATVYVVIRYFSGNGQVRGVFSSMAAAQGWIDVQEDACRTDFDIEEHMLDEVPAYDEPSDQVS